MSETKKEKFVLTEAEKSQIHNEAFNPHKRAGEMVDMAIELTEQKVLAKVSKCNDDPFIRHIQAHLKFSKRTLCPMDGLSVSTNPHGIRLGEILYDELLRCFVFQPISNRRIFKDAYLAEILLEIKKLNTMMKVK